MMIHFFNPRFNDIISGNLYNDFMPLSIRFRPHDKREERKKENSKKMK